MQRLLIVYNENSSQYIHVRTEILDRLPELKGYIIGKYIIKKNNFEDNVSRLAKIIKDDDIVISAGGDATASMAMNAIIRSDKSTTLAVLSYGNFNDLARTLGTKKLDDILRNINPRHIKKLYPLDIAVDGKHWRYASCYVTMGMTGEAVEIFDQPEVRKTLQKGRKSSWRSYLGLAKWYFKNRHTKIYLPGLSINGVKQHRKTSDYAAVNGKSMCRVMKGGDDYLRPKIFRSMAAPLANFWNLTTLMTKSIFHRVPGIETTGDILEFSSPTTVELQAEGEYKVFENIKKIEVKKGETCLKVIQN